ncbi:MAG: porin family protein [Polyangiaceae bacterium]|nr:porin family protein [Polyangiaceae bacterium]MCW5792487.1 porin family protein [Polyangiaceae bacterium]
MNARLPVLCVAALACGVPLLSSTPALAEDCPSWFCDEEEAVEEEAEAEPETPPPVVVYQPAEAPPPQVVVVHQPPPKKKQAPPKKRWKREWGVNLRLQAALMGRDADDRQYYDEEERGMAGLGVGLRYRPLPHFALEGGLDIIGGRDYQRDDRVETALTFSGILFINPKDRLQVYALGGLGVSSARVVRDRSLAGTIDADSEAHYSYLGMQAGFGLEWRVARKTALNFDIIGFVRGRTDEDARYEYEFTHPDTGEQTNASGGGLMRLGLTFYW